MRNLFLLLLTFISFTAFSQKNTINLNNNNNSFNIIKQNQDFIIFENNISTIKYFDVISDYGTFTKLIIDKYVKDYSDLGNPDLPSLHKLIEIPDDANISITIISYNTQEIDLNNYGINNKLLPVQPSVPKATSAKDVPFYYNESSYKINQFSSKDLVEVKHLGKMRGVNLSNLIINPIQYNPVTNKIKVYNSLRVKIEFKNANLSKTKSIAKKYYSPAFDNAFSEVINYKSYKDTLISTYPVKYVIIADPIFRGQLDEFIKWKIQKGFNVITAYTDDPNVGNTTTSIKTYLQDLYTNATPTDPAPSFVLFVGDVDQIPAFSGTTGSHPTDLYYCEYDGGSDYFPELYYGRFSANNTAELKPQIDKTLEYEKYLMPDPSYLNEVIMVAGVDASNAPTYGNGQINYGTDNYFNATHGLTSHTYLYGSGTPILSNDSEAADSIHAQVSHGVGFVNYTAHCSPDGWADPSFTVADVHNLTNSHRFPLSIGNCCLSNKFDELECFGEAMMRGDNKGAIGHIGGSNSTLWDEDYYWGVGVGTVTANPTYASTGLGAYDGVFHDHGEPENKWHITNAQVLFAGNLSVTESGSSNTKYYWEIYHLMGDPSVMAYFAVPLALTVNHPASMPVGISTINLSTESGAYVALSMNDTILLDADIADVNGNITLTFPAINTVTTLKVVGTKQNRAPYTGQINIIPDSSAFITYISHNIDDNAGNNNGLADYSESILINMTLGNLGTSNAVIDTVIISTNDTNITITDNFNAWDTIHSGSNVLINSSFAFTVKPFITDQHQVNFNGIIKDINDSTWNFNFTQTLNAPKFDILNYSIDDATGNQNGRLDPGETIILTIPTKNIGHSDSPTATGTLSTSNTYITITQATQNLNIIKTDSIKYPQFEITLDNSFTSGQTISFDYFVDGNPYTLNATLNLPVGQLVEDWESNSFTQYYWNNTSTVPWIIVSGNEAYEGNFAARSGNINDNQNTDLYIDINVLSNDSISFFKKVSCEQGESYNGTYYWYDNLEFLIDGNSYGKWDGIDANYTRVAYPITSGNHQLHWTYTKDQSVSEGDDCAWVDFIVFPPADNIVYTKPIEKNKIVEFNIFPNPAKDFINIYFGTEQNTNINIEIFNSLGQIVYSFNKTNLINGSHDIKIDTKLFEKGVYICKLQTGDKISSKVFVKN